MKRSIILLIVILTTYFSILLFYLSTSCLHTSWCGQDMDQYIDYSNSLLQGKGYAAQEVASLYFVKPERGLYVPETMRLPAFSLLLTGGRLLFDHSRILIYLNIFFLLVILVYSYKIFSLFLDNKLIIPAMTFILMSPTLLYYVTLGNVDLFVYATLTAFTYHASLLYKGNVSFLNVILISFLGVITLFSRQNTLLFIFPFLILLFYDLYIKQKKKQYLKSFIIICCVFTIFLGCWATRNYLITKSFTLSTLSPLQLFSEHIYFTHFPTKERDALYTWLYVEKNGEKYMDKKRAEHVPIPIAFVEFNKEISHRTKNFFIVHPTETFLQFRFAVRSLFMDSTFTWDKKRDVIFYMRKIEQMINPLLLLGIILCLALFTKTKTFSSIFSYLWISSLLYIVFSAFYHGTVIGNRGILPIYTLLVLLFFHFLITILNHVHFFGKDSKKSRFKH